MIKYDTNIIEDISGADLYLTGFLYERNKYNHIYPFTNENLRDTLKLFDVRDKDVLTVAGSGDQAMNLALMGAKKIDVFDTNKLTYFYLDFKRAAALTMKYDEFEKTFLDFELTDDGGMPKEKFKRIASVMSQNSTDFWSWYAQDGYSEFTKNLLFNFIDVPMPFARTAKDANPYFDKENYKTLQKNLEQTEIEFMHKNVWSIDNTERKYDAVFCSNIAKWVGERGFESFAQNNLPKIMNDGARAQVHYIYIPEHNRYTNVYNKEPFVRHSVAPLDKNNNENVVVTMDKETLDEPAFII